jgi:hypothetical protein
MSGEATALGSPADRSDLSGISDEMVPLPRLAGLAHLCKAVQRGY